MRGAAERQGVHRRIIVMQPGPIHLFWTSGAFYIWALKDRFDFVLIVPEAYRDNARFAKLTDLASVRHVEYIDLATSLRSYVRYSARIRAILETYKPAYLLMHNRSYAENQHAIHWARRLCPNAFRYQYQNGRASLRWDDDFAARRSSDIEVLVKCWPTLAMWPRLAGIFVDARSLVFYFLRLKLFPLLAMRTAFEPPLNVHNGGLNRAATDRHCNNELDWLLAYLDVEIAKYHQQGIKNVVKIEHPLFRYAREVFTFFDGDLVESKTILIVPSYGYTSRLLEAGWSAEQIVAQIGGCWCSALDRLMQKFPGHQMKMKLHPASANDPVWTGILRTMIAKLPALNIVSPFESAELHVAQAKVIVGDVTSVLWWAGLYGGKVVISLDIFGYPAGDELQAYGEHIYYVTDLKTLPDQPKVTLNDEMTPDIHTYFSG